MMEIRKFKCRFLVRVREGKEIGEKEEDLMKLGDGERKGREFEKRRENKIIEKCEEWLKEIEMEKVGRSEKRIGKRIKDIEIEVEINIERIGMIDGGNEMSMEERKGKGEGKMEEIDIEGMENIN